MQERRSAGRRVLVLLAVGMGLQIGGWALAAGHPAVEGTVLLALTAAMYAGTGLLAPTEPGAFAAPRSLRRRRTGPAGRRSPPDGGVDLLGAAAFLAVLLPWQVVMAWLQDRGLGTAAELLIVIGVVAAGTTLLYGVVALRRRRDPPDDAPVPSAVVPWRRDPG